jgi:hypothetical protein
MTARAFCIPKDEKDLKAEVNREVIESLESLKNKFAAAPYQLCDAIDKALQVAPPARVESAPLPPRPGRGGSATRSKAAP